MTNDSKSGGRQLDKDATISVMGGVGTIPQDREVTPTAYQPKGVLVCTSNPRILTIGESSERSTVESSP